MKRGARMKRLLIVAALAVGLASPAWGQDFDAGLAAYKRGDYSSALQEWRPLGVMYASGEGVPQDDAEA